MRVCSEMSQGTPPRNILVEYEECGAAVLDLWGSCPDQVQLAWQTLAADLYSLAALSRASGSLDTGTGLGNSPTQTAVRSSDGMAGLGGGGGGGTTGRGSGTVGNPRSEYISTRIFCRDWRFWTA